MPSADADGRVPMPIGECRVPMPIGECRVPRSIGECRVPRSNAEVECRLRSSLRECVGHLRVDALERLGVRDPFAS